MQYTVRSGDSISKIARDVVGNMALWPQIASVNNLVAPYTIYPGQVLLLPEIGVARTVSAPAPARLPTPGVTTMPSESGGTDWIALAKKYWWVGALIVVLLPVALAPPRKRKA